MIIVPKDGHGIVKFIGIDPGSSRPGVGIISYDVPNKEIVRAVGICLHLDKMMRRSPYRNYQTERYLKLKAFGDFLSLLFRTERPSNVASEHPYINITRPGAVIPLAECLIVTENAVFEYNPYMGLEKIDPSSIKNAVGVKGNSKEKHAMTEGIKQIPEIMDVLVNDIETMDNNAVDSVAVAYCSLRREYPL